MPLLAASSFMHFLFGSIMLLISVFLILLVLVQRGRGGGLTGALGGMGGQSAFGTKAGDTFTRITYGAAIVWIFVCMMAIKMLQDDAPLARTPSRPTITTPQPAGTTGTETPAPSTTKGAGEPTTKSTTPEAPASGSSKAADDAATDK